MIQQQLHYQQVESDLHLETTTFVGVVGLTPVVAVAEADLIQTPLHALRGWRGNCDIKVLLCDCHEGQPTPEDISEVTDYYVVACACKGNETLATERDTLRGIVAR